MAYLDVDKLPSKEELVVPELRISSPAMFAAAPLLGLYCEKQSLEFTLCKQETNDPRACLREGRYLTECGHEFFHLLKKTSCGPAFQKHWECLEWQPKHYDNTKCLRTKKEFEGCAEKELNMKAAPFAYFTKSRIHYTEREKPVETYEPRDFRPRAPVDHSKINSPPSAILGDLFWPYYPFGDKK